MGLKHEADHAVKALPGHIDLGDIRDLNERFDATAEHIRDGSRPIFQGALVLDTKVNDQDVKVVGLPDFLVPNGSGYMVRDAKLARSITKAKKPGIVLQLQIYGWLYERALGFAPEGLEVLNGDNDLVPIERDDAAVEAEFERLLELMGMSAMPDEVVGWSKCGACGFKDHCWPAAVEQKAPGVIPGVDAGFGRALMELGIDSYTDIPDTFSEASLAALERPWGKGLRKVGDERARKVMASVRAHLEDRPILIGEIEVPSHSHYVMFDLEGLPPDTDGPDRVYLWGMQVYPADGGEPDEPIFALAGFGEDGDREGWMTFLAAAARIRDTYGADIPFVHWASYEKTKISAYLKRFGDLNGTGKAILENNLLDLLPVTERSLALPLPSYSLKVIEGYVGYTRTLEGYKGDQSIARYMEAVEAGDGQLRQTIIDELCQYNGEDLEATWAVLSWLLDLSDQRLRTAAGNQSGKVDQLSFRRYCRGNDAAGRA